MFCWGRVCYHGLLKSCGLSTFGHGASGGHAAFDNDRQGHVPVSRRDLEGRSKQAAAAGAAAAKGPDNSPCLPAAPSAAAVMRDARYAAPWHGAAPAGTFASCGRAARQFTRCRTGTSGRQTACIMPGTNPAAVWHRSCNAAMRYPLPIGRATRRSGTTPVDRRPQDGSLAPWPARHKLAAGGLNDCKSVGTESRHSRGDSLYLQHLVRRRKGGADVNPMVNIKMPPDQFCMSFAGANPLASYIRTMVVTSSGAADACGR
jgi:hypothetical protein